jgi:hypothetical protein
MPTGPRFDGLATRQYRLETNNNPFSAAQNRPVLCCMLHKENAFNFNGRDLPTACPRNIPATYVGGTCAHFVFLIAIWVTCADRLCPVGRCIL